MAFLAGVLVALGLGALAVALTSVVARRRFRAGPQAFTCRVRRPRRGRRRWRHWPHWRTQARWVSDVLVVRSTPLGLTSVPYAARIAPGATLRPVSSTSVRRLGPMPLALLLGTRDGPLDVAVADVDKELVVGPYLTAALTGQPSAPREGRN